MEYLILSCQTIILMLSGLSIGLEVTAFINDKLWNSMIDHKKDRFSFQEFIKCKLYWENGTSYKSNRSDYDSLFQGHRRDLPFEQIFLEMMCTAFVMYIIVINIYIGWKKNVMANIYICIVSNLIGLLVYMVSFGLILSSTLMYTDSNRKYLGSKSCHNFRCHSSSCTEKDFRERAKGRYDDTRSCMEKLHICQLNGFKDRVVFLVLGCIVASSIALLSSCRRLRRKRSHRITPNVSKSPAPINKSIPQPSLENVKGKTIEVPLVNSSSTDDSSNDFKAS